MRNGEAMTGYEADIQTSSRFLDRYFCGEKSTVMVHPDKRVPELEKKVEQLIEAIENGGGGRNGWSNFFNRASLSTAAIAVAVIVLLSVFLGGFVYKQVLSEFKATVQSSVNYPYLEDRDAVRKHIENADKRLEKLEDQYFDIRLWQVEIKSDLAQIKRALKIQDRSN